MINVVSETVRLYACMWSSDAGARSCTGSRAPSLEQWQFVRSCKLHLKTQIYGYLLDLTICAIVAVVPRLDHFLSHGLVAMPTPSPDHR